jgi:hypothetical protein
VPETQTPGAITSPATKLPAPLTTSEKGWSAVLVVLGSLLIVGVLIWYAASTGGELKSKESKVTEPVGANATGTKTTETTEYADTIVIFALTAGAGFLLAGAFYGRLRELKLGALTLGLTELSPEKKQELEQKIDQQVEATVQDPQQQQAAKVVARAIAEKQVAQRSVGMMAAPTTAAVDDIAASATKQAVHELKQ